MNRPLFRQKAMEQLASPDQLDQLMEVTTTRGWLVLLTLGIVLAAAILWGIFGSVPTRVSCEGIILLKQGVFSVFVESPGKVRSVAVREGETVAKGQTIATIHSEALEKKIEDLTFKLDILRKEYEADLEEDKETFHSFQELLKAQRKNYEADQTEAQKIFESFQTLLKSQRATLEQSVQNQKTRLAWLREKLGSQEELYREQLITLQTLNSSRQEILDAENEIQRLEDEIKKLGLQEKERKNDLDERKRKSLTEIKGLDDQERQRKASLEEKARKEVADIRRLENELDLAKKDVRNLTILTSPHSGRVLKVEVKNGTIVNPGERVAMLEADGADQIQQEAIYDAVVYASPVEGKRIKPGMEVQVVPTTVKAEEYGMMLGRIVSVSDYPVSQHAMLSTLENPELVQTMMRRGAPIEVWVDLLSDPGNPSGFRWSSPKGPPEKINPGTLCAANVVVQRQAPISLVIPFLRKAIFSRGGVSDE